MTDVSIVIGFHNQLDRLLETLESIIQQHTNFCWECLIVVNGPFLKDQRCAQALLTAWKTRLQQDPRIRLIESPAQGLTNALEIGCREAKGSLIARIDVGDAMATGRLQRQYESFQHHPDLVLATSDVEICGPAWEHLRIDSQPAAIGRPLRADTVPPEKGIGMDIPHHASVMFRRDAYIAADGYRSQFYFAQDWDLWFRLASHGKFIHLPEVLTRVRLFSDGLSSRHWREQRAIARLALACHIARRSGKSEAMPLQKASTIRPHPTQSRRFPWDGRRAEGAYFIAEALRRNGDRRCRTYFLEALRFGFWKPRIWIRTIQSLKF